VPAVMGGVHDHDVVLPDDVVDFPALVAEYVREPEHGPYDTLDTGRLTWSGPSSATTTLTTR
jgi:hypothetical protein